jgi:hypothetical protein
VGQLADLIVPSKDFFKVPEDEISFLIDLTVVGGRVVYGAGEFAQHDDNPLPPAMPDWSPVRRFGGYAPGASRAGKNSLNPRATADGSRLRLRHELRHARPPAHADAWASNVPASDPKSFFGALGCSCWMA